MKALSPRELERRLRGVVRAISDVNRNVAFDLVLQEMLLDWSVGAATM